MWMQWFGVKLNFGHRGKIEAKTGGGQTGGAKKNNWGAFAPPLPPVAPPLLLGGSLPFYYISLDSCMEAFKDTLPILCNGFKCRLYNY